MLALGTGVTPPTYGSFYVFWIFFQKYKIWTPRSASHPDFTGGVPQVVDARTDGCLRIHREGSWMVFLER